MHKYSIIIQYIRNKIISKTLKLIYSTYKFIAEIFYLPIMNKVELSALNYRLRQSNWKNNDKIYRFRRMKYHYKYNKQQNDIYKKNMETIAKMSNETGIPQYKLIETHDLYKSIIVYIGKDEKNKNKEYSNLEPIYYIYKLLPTYKQTITAIYDLLVFFKHTFQKYVWNYVENFYFYYWIQRTLLYRIRKIDPAKASTIRYRWEQQKYIYREKRLRMKKQIAHYKKLKASQSI